MNKQAITKLLLVLLVVGVLVQVVLAADTFTVNQSETQTAAVSISDEVLNKIKQSDPANYDRNVANYQNQLTALQVPESFKSEIERLIMANYRLPDLLIAYEFLYHHYGLIGDLEGFVTKKNAGNAWKTIFAEYNQSNAPFVPKDFAADTLETLMETPGIASDDIMLADRVSFEAGKPFDEVINAKVAGQSWREITAKLNILNGSDKLPRVQVTSQQLEKYTKSGRLTQQQVVEAFVLAYKVGKTPDEVVTKVQSGYTEEAVFAESYQQKYD